MTKAMRVLCVMTLLAGAAAIANAQDNLRVNVPFQFSVNGKTLPAGTYTVSRAFDGNPGVRLLQGAGQSPVAFNVASESGKTGSTLTFHRYGETYFLSDISTPTGHYSLPKTRWERLAAESGTTRQEVVAGK
jgi:hypothetical protein